MSVSTAISHKLPKIALPKVYTLAEYLMREERAKYKHEFYNGTILKMPNATFNHNLIAMNTSCALRNAIKLLKQKYYLLGDGQKVYIEAENIALYPDALVIFEKPIFYQGLDYMLLNPLVVVEVLSRSTSLYDRTSKFDLYEKIPSFKEYVLIDSKKIKVETRYREAPDLWRISRFEDNNDVKLKSLDVTLKMNDIYEDVQF